MARRASRSAHSGRFVKRSTAQHRPRTTSTERVGAGSSNRRAVHRSTITGQFVTKATAARHEGTTIRQMV